MQHRRKFTSVLNCSYSLAHNCCPDVVKNIHEISQQQHSGSLILELSDAHHFDIAKAATPEVATLRIFAAVLQLECLRLIGALVAVYCEWR